MEGRQMTKGCVAVRPNQEAWDQRRVKIFRGLCFLYGCPGDGVPCFGNGGDGVLSRKVDEYRHEVVGWRCDDAVLPPPGPYRARRGRHDSCGYRRGLVYVDSAAGAARAHNLHKRLASGEVFVPRRRIA